MKKSISGILLLFLCQVSIAQSTGQFSQLRSDIDSLFNATKGDFAIAFRSLSEDNPQEILINEKEEFHAASTMKTPVMMEIFKQAGEGKFSLSDSITVKNEFASIVSGKPFSLDISRDSGDKLYEKIGEKAEIEDLVIDMIIHSSNLATNLLVELVGAENVTRRMRDLGAKDIMVLRGVEDIEAYEAGLSNSTTAYDLMLIFEHLAQENSSEADKMIKILLQQEHNDIIPAMLPSEVKVAHKTGSITGLRHDSGIVFLSNGEKYILVLLSKNMEDPEQGVEMLANVSKLIYVNVLDK